LTDLTAYPDHVRNVAVVGHLHHGKTALMDLLISETHDFHWDLESKQRYTDVYDLERDRGISIKSMPMSIVLQDLNSKSFLVNLMDTPGNYSYSLL
jgi:U5 small nuclear ribonucleoprotein component